ncbi:MAG: hypothetical protein NVS3B18_06490 [Candidatus Dormibacteria bacterium]
MVIATAWPTFVAAGAGFLLGCRHGLDWDHIAAITDLTTAGGARAGDGEGPNRGRPVALAVWYCIGHGMVIALLGAAVGVLGLDLPAQVDRVLEVVVGATLILLGALVLWQLGRDRSRYRLQGRWRPVIAGVRRAWARARRRDAGPGEAFDDLGPGAAFSICVLHGTGAETPTKVVHFAAAGSSRRAAAAKMILIAFIAGLIACDVIISLSWLVSRLGARRIPRMEIGLGLLTGISSALVGALFVSGHSGVLPALFGG